MSDTAEHRVERIPLVPLRDVVVYPGTNTALLVGRPRSLDAIEKARAEDNQLLLVTQRARDIFSPRASDLYTMGTVARVEHVLTLPDGTTKVVVSGEARAKLLNVHRGPDSDRADAQVYAPDPAKYPEYDAQFATIETKFKQCMALNPSIPAEALTRIQAEEALERRIDMMVPPLRPKHTVKQSFLEKITLIERLKFLEELLDKEIAFLEIEQKIRQRSDGASAGRLGGRRRSDAERDARQEELEELEAALEAKILPKMVRARADREFKRFRQMNPMSAEATVVRTYLDWILELPWEVATRPPTDIAHAEATLAREHHGLEEVKLRILEYLSVSSRVEKMRGPILCLVGPPGVGKTSLARSIARATERPFVKISLAGVRDEAELRGHRRTYIGALPGRLIQGIRRAERLDCVMLLDEVDKMSSDLRGDPAHALLEVLDPEQNSFFQDNYLEVDFDLSHIIFVCTANSLQTIPLPLRDRLEILEVNGYADEEKVEIAERYLIPKQQELHGLDEKDLHIARDAVLGVIQDYTRESGVRELERKLARVARKAAHQLTTAPDEAKRVTVDRDNLAELLGPQRLRSGMRTQDATLGLVNGLAVSPWGGEVLAIEVVPVPGTGKILLTGRLGDWLKESANAARTYVRSRAAQLGLPGDFHETLDLHIHYPGNPIKTDGPSAGIAMATAMVSALTKRPARHDVAMTGEISLGGRVLPIGGLRAKVLAAHRDAIGTILVPIQNLRQVDDIPTNVRDHTTIIGVSSMAEVLDHALLS